MRLLRRAACTLKGHEHIHQEKRQRAAAGLMLGAAPPALAEGFVEDSTLEGTVITGSATVSVKISIRTARTISTIRPTCITAR